VVGFGIVLQHIPLIVTEVPPLAVTFPPDIEDILVITEIAAVVTTGTPRVEKGTSEP
jgi:hypothetical protein